MTPNALRSLLTAVLFLVPLPAALCDDTEEDAQGEDRRWRILLQQQLKSEKNCDLLEILTFQEYKLGDDNAIEARVSCIDGREFDATRKRTHQKFNIELCQPSVC